MVTESRQQQKSDKRGYPEMSLLGHLDELRSTLIQSLAVAAVAAMVCWFFSRPLLDLLVEPIVSSGRNVYFHQPVEAFLTRMKIAVVCGVFLILPYILFRVYQFVTPGLYQKERRMVVPLLVSSVLLFYGGVAFAYLILIPKVIVFMLGFGTEYLLPLISIGHYFAFVARLCLAFGLVFEMPLVVMLLSLMGVVNPRLLLKGWRYALVLIVIMSAVLTPPDVLSQLLMAGPVMLLYILSVLVAIVVTRRRSADSTDDD
jgi:sec-independent protein translocase protein TatC